MHSPANSDSGEEQSIHRIVEDLLGERLEALASWIQELDLRVHTTSVAGDEKALKELRSALEAWTKRDPKFEERLTNRVDVLADRFTTLTATVNTTAATLAGSGGEIAALRREVEGGTTRIESVLADLKHAPAASADLDELRRAVATLSDERPARKGDRQVDELSERIDNLAARLDMLAKTIATTAAGLAGRDGEIASLRRSVEDGNARVEHVLAELQRTERTDVGELEARLESLAGTVTTAIAGFAGEDDVVALRARLEQDGAKIDVLATELRQSIGALSSQVDSLENSAPSTDALLTLEAHVESLASTVEDLGGRLEVAIDAGLGTRLDAVTTEVEDIAHRLARAEAASSERWTAEAAMTNGFERLLADLTERLGEVERDRDTNALEIGRAAAAWSDERTWVREQLDALVAAVSETRAAGDFEPLLGDITRRLETVEQGHEAFAADAASERAAWMQEREELAAHLADLAAVAAQQAQSEGAETRALLASVVERLDALERSRAADESQVARSAALRASEIEAIEARLAEIADRPRDVPPSEDEELERLLVAFADRIEANERAREVVAAEIAHATEDWATGRTSLEKRLDEVAGRMSALSAADGQPAPAGVPEEELGRLRLLIEGLRMRQAAIEKEFAASSGSHDVVARLDALASRLESLETKGMSRAWPPVTPVDGEGRYRLELRTLELRTEQAEEAARENREALLIQLERLASRVEWRLQRLESDETKAEQPEPTVREALGRVVPIRGGTET